VAPQLGVDAYFVFVERSVHINRPIAKVTAALAAGPSKWFPHFDGPIHAEVGPRVAGLELRKNGVVEIGQPLTDGDWTEVPITWRATFIQRLFPVMTGKAEFAPVDDRVTRVTVCGMYQPPLGSLGKQLDDALLHRVAEATVKELAESIGKRLEALTADAAGAASSPI
jgi:hypothetical protein